MANIVVLGASGYIGEVFVQEAKKRGLNTVALSRSTIDYSNYEVLLDYLQQYKPDFLINAAGYVGRPNVDACEENKAEAILGNVILPMNISRACLMTDTPWGHVSSGCIFSGAKIMSGKRVTAEKNLMIAHVRDIVAKEPWRVLGYDENDIPNFSFHAKTCSFYSGTKALGEEIIRSVGGPAFIWRLRIPFDEYNDPRNYLTKLQLYEKVYSNVNSLSHRRDFVRACLDIWEKKAEFGTYNVTNPGYITTEEVIEMMTEILKPAKVFSFWKNDEEFYAKAAKALRSNCILDTSKLERCGVHMRPVRDALQESLMNYQ